MLAPGIVRRIGDRCASWRHYYNRKIHNGFSKVVELHTYEIKSYTGEIQLRVHDDMHWVVVSDLPAHPQLPADLIVSHLLFDSIYKTGLSD